ncbi:MAG TPA: TRAP transporter TatT component family protein [Pyrinomonadaceae bacterium]|jgi:predicted Zn-dependent protease|nr:TRAP transporter TatT component family protein [Pyrinomonadaceae bacterium]
MRAQGRLCKSLLFFLLIALVWAVTACRAERLQAEATATDQQSALNYIAQADKLYAGREDLAQARQAIALLKQARSADLGNYEAAWKLSKFNYYLGDFTSGGDERERSFHDGIEAGKAAVKLQPEKPEGHFWLGANYGGKAQVSTLSGFSAVKDMRQEMETVLRLDEGFESGSAYMALGQLYLEAPGMLGGDSHKAVEILEKGLRYGVNSSPYRLQLAKAYLAVKRKDDARKQLNALLDIKPDPLYLPEFKKATEEARKLLDKN